MDVAQDCIVTVEDCFTDKYITMEGLVDGGEVVEQLSERVLGRTLTEDFTKKQIKLQKMVR